jgi:hypothetical protein
MGTSLLFLSELIDLYQLWETLDPDRKYPPGSFFDDLADEADRTGWQLRVDLEDLKTEYERKRGTSEDSEETEEVGA